MKKNCSCTSSAYHRHSIFHFRNVMVALHSSAGAHWLIFYFRNVMVALHGSAGAHWFPHADFLVVVDVERKVLRGFKYQHYSGPKVELAKHFSFPYVDWILTEILIEVHPRGTAGVRVMFYIRHHFLKEVHTLV